MLVLAFYAILGVALGLFLRLAPRLREHGGVQLAAVGATLSGAAAALSASAPASCWNVFDLGVHSLAFLAASLCHVPHSVYVGLSGWSRLLEHLTSGTREPRAPEEGRRSQRAEWRLIEECLRRLAENPLSTHHREELALAFLRLGLLDSAISQYRRAVECEERGYSHGRLLFRTCYLLVEHKQDVASALPLLRRLTRLYPRSCFAAYARRVLNCHEARTAGGSPLE